MEARFKRKNDGHDTSRKRVKKENNFGQLDKDTYTYFARIADVLKDNVDEEEMKILATNTLQQTEGIEIEVCKHILAASILEKIISYAPWSQIHKIVDSLNKEDEESKGSCESHLEEAIIKEAGRRVRLDNCEEREDCLQYIINRSEQIYENFENGIFNLNINFVARTCLSVCSGYEDKGNCREVISKNVVKRFSKKLMAWNKLAAYYQYDAISGFLQILLFSLKAVSDKKCKKFTKFLIRNCFVKEFEDQSDRVLSDIFENVSCSRLLEAVITVSPPELQEEIYQKLFSNSLPALILSRKGQFPVCKLITSCTNKLVFESIMEKLSIRFNELLAANNLNILHALSEACVNTGEKQGEFVKNLITALGCSGPNKEKYVLICIVSMKVFSDVNLEDVCINYHGSLIFQNLLKFKKPQKFVEALLSLNMSVLKRILTDSKGSHIMDAFMASSSVGAKSKERVLNILKGHYSDLAMDKYGSRSFDVIWANSNVKNRSLILSEMNRNILKTKCGSIIASKTGLEMYIRDKCAWERAYNSRDKFKLFSDIKSKR